MAAAAASSAGREPRAWVGRCRLALGAGWWLLPVLVLSGLGATLVAQRHGLWYDELYTAEVAPLSLGDLGRAVVRGEGTIPYLRDAPPSYNAPYYAVAHVWLSMTGLAADEVGLRLLSLVCAVGGVGTATAAVGRMAGRRVALAFGLVVGSNPFVVEYAAEARGYGLALLAAGLLLLAFARWVDGCAGAAALVGLAAAGLGLAHWFGLLVVGAVGVAGVVLAGQRGPRRPGPPAPGGSGAVRSLCLAVSLGSLPAVALVAVALANGVGASGAEWIADVGGAVPRLLLRSWSGGSWWVMAMTVALVGVGLVLGRGPARIVGGAWIGVPLVVVTAAEFVRPVYVDRYLLPALLGLGLLAAVGGAALRPRGLGVVAVAALVAASATASARAIGLGPKEDGRGAVEAVAAAHRPGQPVVAAARWDALGLDHHARRHHPGLVADLVLPPAPVPSGASTVWVVRRAEGGVKGDGAKQAELDRRLTEAGLRLVEEHRFPGRYAATLTQRWAAPA